VIDRDLVEPSKLQRQAFFDENDARGICQRPRLFSATQLRAVFELEIGNRWVRVRRHAMRTFTDNLLASIDSGWHDNFATRFLLNDFAVSQARPWIDAAAVGS